MCRREDLGFRHVQVILLFFAVTMAFAMRVNMSIAIVAMTTDDIHGSFNWNMQTQSVVLSSFLWGYIVLQIPGGLLAEKYGGKILLLLCIIINSGVSLVIPNIAREAGWTGLCYCRVLQGLAQGVLFPTTHCLVSQWVPLSEKSRLGAVIYAGSFLGTSVQLMVSGFIIDFYGWQGIFYVNGTCGTIWFVFYMYFGANSPENSKMISPEERLYIETSLGHLGEKKKYKTPWKKIFTSVPFYALLTSHCGHSWGFWTLITELPSYVKQVLGVHIKASGIMSAIPYLVLYILSFPFGFLSDYATKNNWCSLTTCRKISNSIGEFGPAIMLIVLCHIPPSQVEVSVAILSIGVGLGAGHLTGIWLTHIDMAPNFAGTLLGVTNFCSDVTGIMAPLIAGILLKDEDNLSHWHLVFYIASGVYFVTNLVYVIFGSCKVQPWNEPDQPRVTLNILGLKSVTKMPPNSRAELLKARRMSAISH